jgi:NhaA family Na+:H+ antiporter
VGKTYKVWNFVSENSLLLIAGAILALFMANYAGENYRGLTQTVLIDNFFIGHMHYDEAGVGHRTLTLLYLVNDVLMALFFAIAGKEVWEGIILKEGELRGRKAATPLIATIGGIVGPIMIYLLTASLFGSTTFDAIQNGWAIPTATDIAFSYIVGRLVFGAGHPAIKFLLLLAIADDAVGLTILAIAYPSGELQLGWLLVSAGTVALTYLIFNWLPIKLDKADATKPVSSEIKEIFGFWPYVVAGCISWYAFQESGIHPALGLLPVIPAIPHADKAFGIFSSEESGEKDFLNQLEHRLKSFVQVVLFFFGLLNAGVEFTTIGEATWTVLLGLIIGKPVGIFLFGMFGAKVCGLGFPEGMQAKDLFVLGCVAAIGFTVALFVSTVAFPTGSIQDAAKLGALFSLGSALIAILAGRLLKIKRIT